MMIPLLPILVLVTGCFSVQTTPPVIDLGYTLHRATLGNTDNGISYFNFSNIRYAAPPTESRRFLAPSEPLLDRTINDGQVEAICAQADPGWLNTAIEVLVDLPITNYQNFTIADISDVDPRTSEDCLLLDVLVSASVYENKTKTSGSAVLVWFHGGGFVQGYKDEDGTGQNFISQSDGGIVYVAINYRLGLFVSSIGTNSNRKLHLHVTNFVTIGMARDCGRRARCRS